MAGTAAVPDDKIEHLMRLYQRRQEIEEQIKETKDKISKLTGFHKWYNDNIYPGSLNNDLDIHQSMLDQTNKYISYMEGSGDMSWAERAGYSVDNLLYGTAGGLDNLSRAVVEAAQGDTTRGKALLQGLGAIIDNPELLIDETVDAVRAGEYTYAIGNNSDLVLGAAKGATVAGRGRQAGQDRGFREGPAVRPDPRPLHGTARSRESARARATGAT